MHGVAKRKNIAYSRRMFPLEQLVRDNVPSAKPELWASVSGAVWRRLAAWVNTRVDPEWPKRPFITTIEPERLLLEVIPNDVIGKPITRLGVYEFAASKLVREYLKAGDVFVDIGANIGYYTVIAGKAVGAAGRVYAFEPSPRIRARLERNVRLNGMAHVQVRGEAVTAQSGVVTLVEPQGLGNDGLAFVDLSGAHGGVEVCSIRLDDFSELTESKPALLKIDVEGGEPAVFEGASRFFGGADAPSILFESFEIARDAAILHAHGYQVFQPLLRNGVVRLTSDLQAPRYRRWEAPNFLAVKSDRGKHFAQSLGWH